MDDQVYLLHSKKTDHMNICSVKIHIIQNYKLYKVKVTFVNNKKGIITMTTEHLQNLNETHTHTRQDMYSQLPATRNKASNLLKRITGGQYFPHTAAWNNNSVARSLTSRPQTVMFCSWFPRFISYQKVIRAGITTMHPYCSATEGQFSMADTNPYFYLELKC